MGKEAKTNAMRMLDTKKSKNMKRSHMTVESS